MSYDHTVKVRICASTHKAIKAQAARLGLSVSEYLRLVYALDISLNADAALEGRIECICLNTSLLQHFFYLYARAGNNLNQATRALNILAKTTLKISRGSQLKYVADCLKSVSSDLDKTSLLLGDIALRPSVYLP
jgi:hypothetical protein